MRRTVFARKLLPMVWGSAMPVWKKVAMTPCK